MFVGVRGVSFDVGELRGSELPDLDVYGSSRLSFGGGISAPVTGRITLQATAERSSVTVPDPRPELGFGRAAGTFVAALGLRWHIWGGHEVTPAPVDADR